MKKKCPNGQCPYLDWIMKMLIAKIYFVKIVVFFFFLQIAVRQGIGFSDIFLGGVFFFFAESTIMKNSGQIKRKK